MGLALLIVGLVGGVGIFGFLIFKLVKFCKNHVIGEEKSRITKADATIFGYLAAAQALFCIVSTIGLLIKVKADFNAIEYILVLIGSILFAGGFDVLFSTFTLYYYKPDLVDDQKKLIRKLLFISIPVVVVGLIVLTEGFAREISYPLPNGVSFKKGIIFPDEFGDTGFSIAWYGILIVTGAIISYFVTDHYIYKKFKKHGLIDTLFIVAFIGGVIGSRLWFCFVLEPNYYIHHFGEVFNIIGGLRGLAIQGGAILGALTGITFVLLFRKYMDVRFVMDVAIPTILLAQVLGRWGNFFNQEVYGGIVSSKALWWVPTIIKNNMLIEGEYRLPLFLIEGIINLGGYFVIRYLLGKVCKFHLGLGYQASFYLVWYGAVRACLEPLRDGFTLDTHESGFGYIQSWIVAFSMIAAGLILYLVFFLIHKFRMKKGLENEFGEKI